MSPRARAKPVRRAGGRPPAENPRDVMLRVSSRDLERWRALATELGYGDVYDLITVAIERMTPDDEDAEMADLGRAVMAFVARRSSPAR